MSRDYYPKRCEFCGADIGNSTVANFVVFEKHMTAEDRAEGFRSPRYRALTVLLCDDCIDRRIDMWKTRVEK